MSQHDKAHPHAICLSIDLDAVEPSDVDAALRVIEAYGRKRFKSDARDRMTRGTCVGLGLASRMDASEVADTATAALEDWNSHLSSAAVCAIEKGAGQVTRLPNSRDLHIILPEWWAKLA